MHIFGGQVNSALSSSITILFVYIIPLLNTDNKMLLSSLMNISVVVPGLQKRHSPPPIVALTTTHHGTTTLIPPAVPHQPGPPLPRRRRVWSDAGHVWGAKSANTSKSSKANTIQQVQQVQQDLFLYLILWLPQYGLSYCHCWLRGDLELPLNRP